jgi:Spy/CpxP family protein refolding chaperone
MPPRALLTAIGATALVFAITIGVAADSTTDTATVAASSVETAVSGGVADARLAAWNDVCVIAV